MWRDNNEMTSALADPRPATMRPLAEASPAIGTNASARWGEETATTTADSVTGTRPTRWISAIRSRWGHRERASATIASRRGTACSSYASYSRRDTPCRPVEREPRSERACDLEGRAFRRVRQRIGGATGVPHEKLPRGRADLARKDEVADALGMHLDVLSRRAIRVRNTISP